MTPTDALTYEHRIIEQVLTCLERMVAGCASTGKLEKQPAHDAITFFRLFADASHHGKEEAHLFPAIEAKGFPREGGPTGVMLQEHEAGRAHFRAMDDAVAAASAGDAEALERFVDHARSLIGLLREHIRREDHCLYPMFTQAINKEDEQRELIEAFEKVDNEQIGPQTRQACIEIANRLSDRFGVPRPGIHGPAERAGCDCWLYGELAEQKRIVDKQNLAMSRELEMARQVQRALIPRRACDVPGLEIAFDYEPVVQVGGDLLDIIPVHGDRVLLFVGDVVGHGVRAALAMSAVKAALLSAAKSDPRPDRVLAGVNKVFAEMFKNDVLPQFVTAACCLVDPPESQAEIALAGHPAPLRFRADPGEILKEADAGLPLGIEKSTEYALTSIDLEPEDLLVFFTDGLIEAMDPSGRQYGCHRLERLMLRSTGSSPGELVAEIRNDLRAHCGGRALADDFALLVVKFVGVGSEVIPPAESVPARA